MVCCERSGCRRRVGDERSLPVACTIELGELWGALGALGAGLPVGVTGNHRRQRAR